MGDRGPPPGGGPQPTNQNANHAPDRRTGNLTWVKDSVSGGNLRTRSFEQIIEDENSQRNIIEIQLQRMNTNSDGESISPKSLTYEDIGELLFDTLEIDPEECISFNFNSGRYDLREVKFKPNIDTSKYMRLEAIPFKEHMVTVTKQRQNIIKVTFKNVPLNVPDEEILTLCAAYGKPVSCVQYEHLHNIRGRGLTGSTRYVDMELEKGQSFENFYWMEGPLPGDVGKRIVVLHNGQPPQCSHCLLRRGAGCRAMGIGKACQKLGTPRGKMNDYMQSLRDKVGYVSMKIKHAEKQARMFPSMIGLLGEKSSEQELQSLWTMEEGEQKDFIPILTPVEEKDKIIAEQEAKLQVLLERQQEAPSLAEALEKARIENIVLKKKISLTRRATEQKILENISNNEFYKEDPHLVVVLSATMNEEEFDYVEEDPDQTNESEASGKLTHRSRKDKFLSSIEDKVDPDKNPLTQERLDSIKNQVLERIKSAKLNRNRSRTDSVSSTGRSKRALFLTEDDIPGRSSSRPRTLSPAAPPP